MPVEKVPAPEAKQKPAVAVVEVLQKPVSPAWNRDYGPATESKINEVVEACKLYGNKAIVALSGIPGTGKSFIASIAAQRFAGEPLLVREIQFHQSFSYEEFIEGMRIDSTGGVEVVPGIFLEWNRCALDDPDRRYVLLIEELTRANISAVLGELMTYLEHRERPFLTVYSRQPVQVAENLTIMATYNPTDRSAIEIDNALIRRLRIIQFPPSVNQLSEMLKDSGISPNVISQLQKIFTECEAGHKDTYEYLMPFGHGLFAGIESEKPGLYQLWNQRIVHLLRRPLSDPHPFTDLIEANYPWRKPEYELPK